MSASPDQIEHIERYLAYCTEIDYPAKSTIIESGDVGDTLYYIIDGTISVVVEDSSGREMILAYLSEGQFFGELGIYEDKRNVRSAKIRTRTPCRVGSMEYKRFLELAKIYPSLMRELDAQVARRLRRTTKKVLDLAFLDVTGRVASCLMDLCKLPEAVPVDEGVQIKISRQEIARIAGCSREMAGRILKDLQNMGLIEARGMQVLVYGSAIADRSLTATTEETAAGADQDQKDEEEDPSPTLDG